MNVRSTKKLSQIIYLRSCNFPTNKERGKHIHSVDLTIIIAFLMLTTGWGMWQGRLNKTTEDYFLAGRSQHWIMVMFSIVATETSVLTFVSIPGLAYRSDWFFLQLAFGFIIGRILVSFFLLPSYFKKGVVSIYEVLGERFGLGIQKLSSGVFLLTRILADGIRFLATAVIVQVLTGWSLPFAVLIIGLVTLIYTVSGGIRTVVWVDSFQFILYLSGALIVILHVFSQPDVIPAGFISDLMHEGKLSIFRFGGNIATNPWLFGSAFIGGIFLSFASHGADYMMVQRTLTCSNLQSARKAMIGSGFFVFFQFSLFLFAGSLIYVSLGGIPLEKDREFSYYIIHELPVGLRGLLLAGVLSAAMSTLSSSINSLASSTLRDWMRKDVDLKTARMVSVAWASVLIVIAMVFDESDKAIVEMGLQIASYTYGGLLSLFLISKLPWNFSSGSLMMGLIASLLTVFIAHQNGIAWTWFILLAILVNIAVVCLSQFIFFRKHVSEV